MRIVVLLPLAAMVAASGCGSERTKQSAPSVPARDLTLQTASSAPVEIASPMELQRTPVEPRAAHGLSRTRRHVAVFQPAIVPAALKSTTATAIPVLQPAAEPVTVVSEAANPHELPPGKTITIIPASSGPSAASDPADDAPEGRTRMGGAVRGGHGGTCRGRGRGSGGGSAPPAVLR
jgi:hypothetical protein